MIPITDNQYKIILTFQALNAQDTFDIFNKMCVQLSTNQSALYQSLHRLCKKGIFAKKGGNYTLINTDFEVAPLNRCKRPPKKRMGMVNHKRIIAEAIEKKKEKILNISHPFEVLPVEYREGRLVKVPIPIYK
jgi:hypothetical protein